MVHRHRFLLAHFLWTLMLLAGTTNRLPAQEQTLGSVSEDDQGQATTAEVVSLPEITGKTSPTVELQAPDLERLLSHLEAFRKAYTPFHIRHREVIKVRNTSEAEILESIGYAPGKLFETEYESAFWDNRSWKRCLGHGVDGEQASDKHLGGDCAGTAGQIVPLPLQGVFLEPKPEDCQLTFEGALPRITFTANEQKDRHEILLYTVSDQWIPKRVRIAPEAKDEPMLEWEVNHVKAFGKDRPPQIIDGELRITFRDGDKETTITIEFVITRAVYGDKVVPGEIDPSLALMPARPAAASVDQGQVMNTPAASNGPMLSAQSPKVTIIDTNSDIDPSEVVRQVVDTLEKDGRARRSDVERVGKPVGLEAILSPVHDMPQEKVVKLIEVLQSLGVDRIRFIANIEQRSSTVVIQCPANVTWRKVRTMTEELEKNGEFRVDVRVAASDEPVTPVSIESLPNADRVPPILPGAAEELPPTSNQQDGLSPLTSRPAPENSKHGELKVFALQNIQAIEAGRIVEQLYITTPSGHDSLAIRLSVDDHNNSLIVRGDPAVIAEVEALLLRLDTKQPESNPVDRSNAISGDDAGLRVNVPALGPEPLAVDYSMSVRGAHGETFSFSIGVPGQNADDLRRQYDAFEQQAANLAEQLRKPLPDPATGETLKTQLRDTVRQAFETRQNLQRAELAQFAKRLDSIQQSIEMREQVSQQIIDHRVQELLDPNLRWESPEGNSGRPQALRSHESTLTDDVTTSPIPSEIQGAWQFQEMTFAGRQNQSPFPEHFLEELKAQPLVIEGEQMTRTRRDGTKTVYAVQYDSTNTPHRLTTTTFRGGQTRTQRYIVSVDRGLLRLGSRTGGSFPGSFEELNTAIETYKRVQTKSTGNSAASGENSYRVESSAGSGLAPAVEAIVAGLDEANAAIQNLSVTTDYIKRQRFLLPFDSTLEMKLTTRAIVDSEGRSRNETDGQQVNIEPDGKSARTYRGRWVGVIQEGVARQLTSYEDNPPTASIDSVLSWHGIDPREFTTHYQNKPVTEIIRSRGAQIAERTEWDGRPVTVVETTPRGEKEQRRYRFWIDTERRIVVRRAIGVRYAEGQPWQEYARIESRDHQQILPGIWLPGKVKYESVDVSPDLKPEELSWSYEGTNRDWQVNRELPADTFELPFPDDIPVSDHRPLSEPGENPSTPAPVDSDAKKISEVSMTPQLNSLAIGKLVLVFFQDQSRKAVPCVPLKINGEYFVVATAPATVVPDGTPHAIDRCFVEWEDNPAISVTYDDRSTKEFFLYRFADGADLPESLGAFPQVGPDMERQLRGGFDPALEIGAQLTALLADASGSYSAKNVRVAAVNVSQKMTLPTHNLERHYDGLFEVDAALPEGTPIFLSGKLLGLIILGRRFVGEDANRSFVVPASRLWEFRQDLGHSGNPVSNPVSEERPASSAEIPNTDSVSPQAVLDAIVARSVQDVLLEPD